MDDRDFHALIATVRERIDLGSLVGRDIALRRCGSVLKGLSPVNPEKTPSLVVWPASGRWRDFSGGNEEGGDCFDYVCRRDGVSFIEALRQLATEVGIELPDARETQPGWADRRKLEDLLTLGARYYHAALPCDIRSGWFHERYGFTDETIDEFGLGWADGRLCDHFRQVGISEVDALSTGLVVPIAGGRLVDFFQGRIVFPYWRGGRVVYFAGRQTERTPDEPWEKAKYRKLPIRSEKKQYISADLANDTFYNEDAGRRAVPELLITEGIADCISAHQAGVPTLSPATTTLRKGDHARLTTLTSRAQKIVICNDAETNRSGEKGAIATALALFDAGRNVRIGSLERPEGTDKIDVNDLVRTQGPAALKAVMSWACTLPRFLIDSLPAELPASDQTSALAPILPMLGRLDPIERQACEEAIKTKFKLRAPTMAALLREVAPEDEVDEAEAIISGPQRRGAVCEGRSHYYTVSAREGTVVISSFRIEPRCRIRLEDGEIIEADILAESGAVHRGVRFPREAWNSSASLLRVLRFVDLQWTGSDANVQGVLGLLAARAVPTFDGTRCLGYNDTPRGPRWVTLDGVICPAGAASDDSPPIYVRSGGTLDERTRHPLDVPLDEERALAARALPSLLQLNVPEVIVPIIGWFFAALLKPRIHALLGHFPLLFVWGTQGSGKSSLIMEVFWPLVGVEQAEPYSASETEFAVIKTLSSTGSVPVFIDEYKPFDMPKPRLNALHRFIRRLYTGEVEERGRADQTVTSYRLTAPVCIAGETRPIEPAIVERILTARPEKDTLLRNPRHVEAFQRLRACNLRRLTGGIIRFLLGRDTAADVVGAQALVKQHIGDREVPLRVRDNLVAMTTGMLQFEAYGESVGVQVGLSSVALGAAIEGQLGDLLEAGGKAVKTGLDYFIEELAVMAVAGRIEAGRHYVVTGNRLYLYFPGCHAAYTEHCNRAHYAGEVLDRKALRRQLAENLRQGGYVKAIDELATFSTGERRRAVVVDYRQIKETLEVDEFPTQRVGGLEKEPF